MNTNNNNLEDLLNAALTARIDKIIPKLEDLACGLAHCDPLIIDEYAKKVEVNGLAKSDLFKETVKYFQNENNSAFSKKIPSPTDDELANQWKKNNSDTVYGLGDFRRYKDGTYPVISRDQIAQEVLEILKKGKTAGIRPCQRLLKSVIELARIQVNIPNELWDSHKEYLPCKNGLLHIPSRTLIDHNPNFYFSTGVDFNYDPDADCPNFKYVLNTTIAEVSDFLQEFAGYALTTDTSHETAVWLYGPPGSGKSTILIGIQAMLGPRSGTINLADIENNSFSLSEIPGKTLLTSFEQPTKKYLATDILNRLISGESVTVNRKFRDPINITSIAKVMWAMNELPVITSANNGLLRRVKVIRFPLLLEDKRDRTLKDQVKKEGPGILNWALDGLDRLNKRGDFAPPNKVLEATNNFKENVDIPALFLEEMCEVGTEYSQKASELYAPYKEWCNANGFKPQSITAIAEEWRRLGLESYPSNGCRKWQGVRIK